MHDKEHLRPDPDTKYTPRHYLLGTIQYLFYIKSSLTGNEPEDLLAYKRKNPKFPDQTTADQFFDGAQFESYRKLGELTGEEVFAR
ncbi:MAG: hypothetical protein JRJ21_10510 [Deltaproteobacteria bacterium]|nr:hypothetical protein [Deltaproteobacteria bacterium]